MTTITRRKPVVSSTGAGASGGYSESATNNVSASNNSDREDERDQDDDKETRLTLMEEVLLLGLKDREVRCI